MRINILNKDCGVSGHFYISLCQNWSATRARSASHQGLGHDDKSQNFLTASTTSTSETACTQQPCLRPGCHLHAVSFSDDIVMHSPLTPLAAFSHLDALLDGRPDGHLSTASEDETACTQQPRPMTWLLPERCLIFGLHHCWGHERQTQRPDRL